jgi:hypothetical protein
VHSGRVRTFRAMVAEIRMRQEAPVAA